MSSQAHGAQPRELGAPRLYGPRRHARVVGEPKPPAPGCVELLARLVALWSPSWDALYGAVIAAPRPGHGVVASTPEQALASDGSTGAPLRPSLYGTVIDTSTFPDPMYLADAAAMVLRDRNHPCIIVWSLCSEQSSRRCFLCLPTSLHVSPQTRAAACSATRSVVLSLLHSRTRFLTLTAPVLSRP